VDAVLGAGGRALVPERIDQAVRGDDLVGAQEKQREKCPLLARATSSGRPWSETSNGPRMRNSSVSR